MAADCAVVAALSAPALAVLVFELLLNATAMLSHGNVRLLGRADRLLRWGVVAPDMHRAHHAVLGRKADSNFGFGLPRWDRRFGTGRA